MSHESYIKEAALDRNKGQRITRTTCGLDCVLSSVTRLVPSLGTNHHKSDRFPLSSLEANSDQINKDLTVQNLPKK